MVSLVFGIESKPVQFVQEELNGCILGVFFFRVSDLLKKGWIPSKAKREREHELCLVLFLSSFSLSLSLFLSVFLTPILNPILWSYKFLLYSLLMEKDLCTSSFDMCRINTYQDL